MVSLLVFPSLILTGTVYFFGVVLIVMVLSESAFMAQLTAGPLDDAIWELPDLTTNEKPFATTILKSVVFPPQQVKVYLLPSREAL